MYDLNKIACELAVEAAEEVTAAEPHRPRLVAGAIGPTNRTLSISPSVEDPGFRNCTWDEVVSAYKTQIAGLIDGGCHIILVETIFDSLNAKAALFAIDEYYEESGCPKVSAWGLTRHRAFRGRPATDVGSLGPLSSGLVVGARHATCLQSRCISHRTWWGVAVVCWPFPSRIHRVMVL